MQPPPDPQAKKPFPFQYLVGCFALGVMLLSCVGFGTAVYFYNQADHHESEAIWSGPDDGFMRDIYREEAEEEKQYSLGSGCCGGSLCFISIAGLGGAIVMARRKPKV